MVLFPAVSYLLELLLVLLTVAFPHVPLLGLGVAECDEALETLQAVMLIYRARRGGSKVNNITFGQKYYNS